MRKEFTLKSLAKEEKIGIFEEGNDKPLTDIEIVKLLNTFNYGYIVYYLWKDCYQPQ